MIQYRKIFAIFILLIARGPGESTEGLVDESTIQTMNDATTDQATTISQGYQNDDPIFALAGYLAEFTLNLESSSACNHTIKAFEQNIRNRLDSALAGVNVTEYTSFFENTFKAKDNYELACITSKTLAREMISRIVRLERYLRKSEEQEDKSKGLKLTKMSFGHMVKKTVKMLRKIHELQQTSTDQLDEVKRLDGNMITRLETLKESGPPTVEIKLLKENLNLFSSFSMYSHSEVVSDGKYRIDVDDQLTLLEEAKEDITRQESLNKPILELLNSKIKLIQNEKEKMDTTSSENTLDEWIPAKQILEQIMENCQKFLS